MQQLSKTKYWNTWTAESPSTYVFLPADFQISHGAFSTKENSYTSFPFERNIRLLEHDSQGRYVHLEMTHAGTILELEYFKMDDWNKENDSGSSENEDCAARRMASGPCGFGR